MRVAGEAGGGRGREAGVTVVNGRYDGMLAVYCVYGRVLEVSGVVIRYS